MSFGYIYILANKSLPYLKIGYTARDPEQRASELSSTGVPTPFYVAYKVYVEQVDEVEKLIHKELRDCRVSDNREFFNIDLSIAVSKTDELITKLKVQQEVVEPDDENFDPLNFIVALRESQYIKESEDQLLREDIFNKKVKFFKEIYNSLKKLNGTLTGEFYSNIFYTLEIDEDSKEVSLYECNTIPELPNGIFINIDYIPCNEDKSPQTEVKRILSTKKWVSEENIKMRECHTDHFKKLVKEIWNGYVKNIKQYVLIDSYSAQGHLSKLFDYECFNNPEYINSYSAQRHLSECFNNREYLEEFVSKYCMKNNINNIVCESWKNVSWNVPGLNIDTLGYECHDKKTDYLKKVCHFYKFERIMAKRLEKISEIRRQKNLEDIERKSRIEKNKLLNKKYIFDV